MNDDPHSPVTLISVATDVEAAAIVATLAAYGISASTTGGFTAGFRAEAPGDVNVIVRREDLDRAGEILADVRRQSASDSHDTSDLEDEPRADG